LLFVLELLLFVLFEISALGEVGVAGSSGAFLTTASLTLCCART